MNGNGNGNGHKANLAKNMKKGVRNTVTAVIPGMGISSQALDIITYAMVSINQKLMEQCIKNKKKTVHVMPVDLAHNALEKVFPGQMQSYARAAGNKSLLMYHTGLLIYKPKVDKPPKPKPKPTKIEAQFISGVPAIASLINPDITLNADARKLLALILQQACKSLLAKTQQISQGKGLLETKDFIEAIDECMAHTLAKHAICEGSRNTMLFLNGMNKYKIKDFEALRVKMKIKPPGKPRPSLQRASIPRASIPRASVVKETQEPRKDSIIEETQEARKDSTVAESFKEALKDLVK